jgi:hypothetical protein
MYLIQKIVVTGFFAGICILGIDVLTCMAEAQNQSLNEIKNGELVRLLNDMEIIAEYNDNKVSPYFIRIIRLRGEGECDPYPKCPGETLYIAVSNYDEAADQKLFVLPKAYGWSFEKWLEFPGSEDPDEFVKILLKKEIATKAGVVMETDQLEVNIAKGYISRVH